MSKGVRRVLRAAAVGCLAVPLVAAPAMANHWYGEGWRDRHVGYPTRPHGRTEVQSTFGAPCDRARLIDNVTYWSGEHYENGQLVTRSYGLDINKKLGGYPVSGWTSNRGGSSTNIDNDVTGHMGNGHFLHELRGGIWSYACRYIAGTSKYSMHSYGIAIDINAAWERDGDCTENTVTSRVAGAFQNHTWYWGKAFCDPMHFQYVTGA